MIPRMDSIRHGRIAGVRSRVRSYVGGIRRSLWQYVDNPIGHSRPVFLLGCGRSGTTMVIDHLARSWQVDLYNEDHPAAFEKWRLRDLDTIADLVHRSHAQITLFKPILDTHLARRLLSRFDDSRMLFSYRHYSDVVNSAVRRFGSPDWASTVHDWLEEDFGEFAPVPPPEETRTAIRLLWDESLNPESAIALYWLFYNRLYFDLSLHNDTRVTLVPYEELVNHPRREFERLCSFVGIEYGPSISHGVYSSSIKRDIPPTIATTIQLACEALWYRLGASYGLSR